MITYIPDFLNPFKGQEIPKKNPTESEAKASTGSAAYQFFSNNIKAIISVSLIYAIIFAGFTPMSVRLMMMAVPLTGVLDVYLATGMSKLAKAFFQGEEVEQLSGELEKAAAENEALKAQLVEAEKKVKELQQLREQIERIQTAAQNYASSLPEGTNLSAENVIHFFATKVVEQNRKIAEQTKENKKKEEEHAQTQHQLEEARKALQNTISKAEEVAAQQNKKVGTLSSTLRSTQVDLNAALVKVSVLQTKIQGFEQQLESSHAKLSQEKEKTHQQMQTETIIVHKQESQMNAPTLSMSLIREEKLLRNRNTFLNLPGQPFPFHQMPMNVGGGNLSFQPPLTARATLPMSKVVFSAIRHLPK